MRRLLFIANTDWAFIQFRLPIAIRAMQEGYEVHLATTFSGRESELLDLGILIHPLHINRSGTRPFEEIITIFRLHRIFQQVSPDLVHLITIKPVLYGGLVARWNRVPTVAAITGLGYLFTGKSTIRQFIAYWALFLYRVSLRRPNVHVIVQNSEDLSFAFHRIGIPLRQITLIRGSGVNLELYPFLPEPNGEVRVIMASRLLYDKGVSEFLEAAEIVHAQYPEVKFQIAGELDPGNPSSLTNTTLKHHQARGVVEFLGQRKDIPDLFASSHIVVLPSYREGLPKVLIEAAACGRAVVTTDVPGCRDAVDPGQTGLLVPVQDSQALAQALILLIQNTTLRRRLGTTARQLALQAFDIQDVISKHIEIYQSIQIHLES